MNKQGQEAQEETDAVQRKASPLKSSTSAVDGMLIMVLSGLLLISGVWMIMTYWETSNAFFRTILTLPPLVAMGGFLKSLVYQVGSFTDVDSKTLQRIDDKEPEVKVVTALDERIGKKENSAFCFYFMEMRNVIENKALGADLKASIQLGYGIWVAGLGVFLYVASLVITQKYFETQVTNPEWKTLFWHASISSTGMFLFVEFLSAWFLKQYRYFQDTAVYLLNLKSILDKHLLAFLAIQDLCDEKSKQQRIGALLNSLEEPINWPSNSHLSRADLGFAKETMESITEILKVLRKDARSKKDAEIEPKQ